MNQATALKFVLVLILFNAKLNSQGMDVIVHLTNDSTLSGKLLSVKDSSIVVRWSPQTYLPGGAQDFPVIRIHNISFTQTVPGEASTLTQVAGATAGIIVGAIVGFVVGDALSPASGGFIRIRWGAMTGTVLGSATGAFLGATIVNSSTSREIRLDPNIPEERDSLKVYLRTQ